MCYTLCGNTNTFAISCILIIQIHILIFLDFDVLERNKIYTCSYSRGRISVANITQFFFSSVVEISNNLYKFIMDC